MIQIHLKMKTIAIIGASGFVGSALLNEALQRGHQVTAIVRHPENIKIAHDHLALKQGDVTDVAALAGLLKGHDVVISAYNAGWSNPDLYNDFLNGSKAIQAAVKQSGVKQLIVIGGAGSLFIAPGLQLVDTPEFPEAYKAGATAARDYLLELRQEKELDWTFVSPAIEMHPGTSGVRKGTYREGLEAPVFDAGGRSIISVEDLAVAVIDEAEKQAHIRERFTVAY